MSDENEKTETAVPDEPMDAAEAELLARKKELLEELDQLVGELRAAIPEAGADAYSPMFFLSYIRAGLNRLAPDVQLGILESLDGMTTDDLMDIDTWKGMAYMAGYSARFQAGQLKDKMNETLPTPLQPDTTINLVKQVLDKLTPEVAKNIMETLQGASREDLVDLETWKGVWYMLNYSLQFQVNQLRDRVMGDVGEDDGEEIEI
ncbi:MAG: hypothetical protein HND44_06325 [Chloroflexi bacterium]|nr:hypothetical protein [Ardenticatenaceae bacterium]MBL1128107.1 hypothetical protein [Chloroflexota bacterium]NOG34178.1 hypothetical protein [Chloroflexota bacterium]GIK55381.1 MAG: hypothetical protein BroJett015_10440 [Chloroflexota bacterium]